MKNTHTPGPWMVADTVGTNGRRTVIEDAGGDMVAHCSAGCSPQDIAEAGDEMEANARLIASAPDLLAALEANLRALNIQSGTASPESMIEWLQRMEKDIRAAIAKARGK